MKRRLMAVMTAAVLAFSVTACGSGSSDTAAADTSHFTVVESIPDTASTEENAEDIDGGTEESSEKASTEESANVADTENSENDLSAYVPVVEKLEKQYGTVSLAYLDHMIPDMLYPIYEGLVYLNLMDMNADGVDELLAVWASKDGMENYEEAIFTIENGAAKKLYQNDCGYNTSHPADYVVNTAEIDNRPVYGRFEGSGATILRMEDRGDEIIEDGSYPPFDAYDALYDELHENTVVINNARSNTEPITRMNLVLKQLGMTEVKVPTVNESETTPTYSDDSTESSDDGDAVSYKVVVTAHDGGVWLRSDAGTEYNKLMDSMIPTGTELTITAEKTSSEGSQWGKTEYNGISGWIYLPATTKTTGEDSETSSSASETTAASDLSVYLGMSMHDVLSALPGSYATTGAEGEYMIQWNDVMFFSDDWTESGTVYTITTYSTSASLYGLNCSMTEADGEASLISQGWTWDDSILGYTKDGKSVQLPGGGRSSEEDKQQNRMVSIVAYNGMPAG